MSNKQELFEGFSPVAVSALQKSQMKKNVSCVGSEPDY